MPSLPLPPHDVAQTLLSASAGTHLVAPQGRTLRRGWPEFLRHNFAATAPLVAARAEKSPSLPALPTL